MPPGFHLERAYQMPSGIMGGGLPPLAAILPDYPASLFTGFGPGQKSVIFPDFVFTAKLLQVIPHLFKKGIFG